MCKWIQGWIRDHPIWAFFLIAIVMSFGLMFPALYFIQGQGALSQILMLLLGRLGVYSPVLAGMLVAHVCHPERKKVSFRRRLTIFLPVWLIAAVVHTLSLYYEAQPGTPLLALIIISLAIAVLPALVFTSAYSGTEGVMEMLSTLIRPRGCKVYYLVALLTFPTIHFLGTLITNLLNGRSWLPHASQSANLIPLVFVTFLSVFLYSGGINEESGWRGFAQKRLQRKVSPLAANLFLWLMLVIWHIPNDIMQYQNGGYLLVRMGLYPFITILFGWVFNRTKGSILAPAIFHASMNAMNPLIGILPITTAGNILLVGFAVIVVIADRMWRKLPKNYPAVYKDIETLTSDNYSTIFHNF